MELSNQSVVEIFRIEAIEETDAMARNVLWLFGVLVAAADFGFDVNELSHRTGAPEEFVQCIRERLEESGLCRDGRWDFSSMPSEDPEKAEEWILNAMKVAAGDAQLIRTRDGFVRFEPLEPN